MTIYDLITSPEIAAYWELKTQDRPPFLGEELFPNQKKLGLNLSWLKGSNGLPVVLKPSAFDVAAIPRPRIGFEKLSTEMPFFKESKYIDEELRQELNKVLDSNNQLYIDTIVRRIFDDEAELLEGAEVQRERMRMMMLTTGTISVEGNGQAYDYDYGMPEDHSVNATVAWSNPDATIIADIRKGIDKIVEDTGVTVARALCSSKVFGYFRINKELKGTLLAISDGTGYLSDAKIKQYFKDELDIEIVTYDKKYRDEKGTAQRMVSDDIFAMFPEGQLGNTWFGTTPEESDLMASEVANVTIVDTGVAVTTIEKADPVNVETKVTMICLPDFPTADQVYIIDVENV
nr:MAG TPA: Major capsid protein [Caudoviricetes sp.]